MVKIKLINVVGARPNFMKISPIIGALNDYNNKANNLILDHILVHTGQHYDERMSRLFFDELGIPKPDVELEVGSASHAVQTAEIMKRFELVILKEKPDLVLVVGDVNSTLACSLVASKLGVRIAHVEAGLRSYDRTMPEEINRIITDHISTFLLCPSQTAVKNLIDEGFENILNDGMLISLDCLLRGEEVNINNPLVINVGDVMYDALLYATGIAKRQSNVLERLQLIPRGYYLLTLHRAENTDNLERLEKIISFTNDVSNGKTVILPMHPRTRKVYGSAKERFTDNVKIIEPVGYFDILMLLKNSALVMTDSGGMQKEAYWLKVPCITLRDETEWVETVQSGWNILYKDYTGSHRPLDMNGIYYGDGKASERIVNAIIKILGKGKE